MDVIAVMVSLYVTRDHSIIYFVYFVCIFTIVMSKSKENMNAKYTYNIDTNYSGL